MTLYEYRADEFIRALNRYIYSKVGIVSGYSKAEIEKEFRDELLAVFRTITKEAPNAD